MDVQDRHEGTDHAGKDRNPLGRAGLVGARGRGASMGPAGHRRLYRGDFRGAVTRAIAANVWETSQTGYGSTLHAYVGVPTGLPGICGQKTGKACLWPRLLAPMSTPRLHRPANARPVEEHDVILPRHDLRERDHQRR